MSPVFKSLAVARLDWRIAAALCVVCLLVAATFRVPLTMPSAPLVTRSGPSQPAGHRDAPRAPALAADPGNPAPILPKDALNRALNTADPTRRARHFRRLGAVLADNLDTAFHTLASLDATADRRAFIRGVFSILAQGDPARALEFAGQIGGDADRETTLVALLHHWCGAVSGRSDARRHNIAQYGLEAGLGMELFGGASPRPDLAARWMRLVTDGKGKLTMLGELAATQMATDPALAQAYGSGLERSDWLAFHNALAYALARRDPAAAWQWSKTLDDPVTRTLAQKVVVEGWMEQDPARAALAAAELPFGAPLRATALRQAAALQSKDELEAWVRTLPANDPVAARGTVHGAPLAGADLLLSEDGSGYPAVAPLAALSEGTLTVGSEQFQSGDHLVGVGQAGGAFHSVQQMNLNEVNRLVQGKSGSVVPLQVAPLRAGGGLAAPRTVYLLRR